MNAHTISEVRFSHGQKGEDAPLTCACAWTGKAGDYAEHRKEVGVGSGRHNGTAYGPALGTAKAWRLKR